MHANKSGNDLALALRPHARGRGPDGNKILFGFGTRP
jgi:hypothetical protein